MVKVEGTLAELEELFGSLKRTVRTGRETARVAKKAVKTTTRKLSQWQRYIKKKSNQIKFKRGPKKGLLDMKAMSRAFKRSKR